MARYQLALCCVFALGTLPALPASAQTNILTLAQAPKRALPIPNKPVSIEEADKAARINNWTVGRRRRIARGHLLQVCRRPRQGARRRR